MVPSAYSNLSYAALDVQHSPKDGLLNQGLENERLSQDVGTLQTSGITTFQALQLPRRKSDETRLGSGA